MSPPFIVILGLMRAGTEEGALDGVRRRQADEELPGHSDLVRKDRLGDRITALHKIVSPFGKDRIALLFLGFPMILLFLQSWLWNGCFSVLPVQLYQVQSDASS